MEDHSSSIDNEVLAGDIKKDFDLDVKDLSRIEEGYVNSVYSGKMGDGEVIVRIARSRNAYPVEIWAYKRFRELGIPSPGIIDYKEKPETIKLPTMIMEKVPGVQLSKTKLSVDKEREIYNEVGVILRKVHQINIDGFGFLVFKDGGLVGSYQTPKEHWESQDSSEHLGYLLKNGLVTDSEYKMIQANYQEVLNATVDQSVFVYNDLHPVHIFSDGEKVTGVIDIGNSFAGDPRYDIAVTLFFLSDSEEEAVKAGYGELALDPMVNKYLVMIAALKTGWRHKDGNFEGAEEAKLRLKELLSTS